MEEIYKKVVEKISDKYDKFSIGNSTLPEIQSEFIIDKAEKKSIKLSRNQFVYLLKNEIEEEKGNATGSGYKGMWRVDLYNIFFRCFPKDTKKAIERDIAKSGGEKSSTFISDIICADVVEELSHAQGYQHADYEWRYKDFLSWVKGECKVKD